MPGTSLIEAANSTAHGLESTFLRTYQDAVMIPNPTLDWVMERDIPGTGLTHKYFFWNSVPKIRRWPRGTKIPKKGFKGIQFEVETVDWGEKIEFHYNDVQDDRTKSLLPHTRTLASDAQKLDERVFFEMISGTVDADLLESVPNAADGTSIFSSSARFGHANGNIVSGTGTTAALIKDDYYSGLERFALFQDTEGRELFAQGVLEEGVVIAFPVAMLSEFEEAFEQKIQLKIVTNVAANENVGGAGVSNVIQDARRKVTLWPTQFLTGTDWYMFLKAAPVKPIFSVLVDPMTTLVWDLNNSDEAKETGYLGFGVRMRKAYGAASTFGALKIDNA